MGIFFKNFGEFRGRHPARTNAAAPLPKRACGAGCKRMAFLISLRIARSATFLKSQRISGYERISGHEKSLPVSQHRSTLLLPPDRQGFSDFCAGSASALKLRTRGARPTTRHLRRNWVQGVSPGRGGARPGTHALRRNWVQGVSPGVRGPCAGSPASGDSAGFQKCRGACPLPARGPRP